jgi:amino acid permease
MFLLIIITINLCGVKTYGEAEYGFSIMKVTAVIGFIILGAVINVSDSQNLLGLKLRLQTPVAEVDQGDFLPFEAVH